MTQWLYSAASPCSLAFEAINASQYDRATALVEALYTAARLSRPGAHAFSAAGPALATGSGGCLHPADRHTTHV